MNSISLELLLALSNWEDFRNGTSLNYMQIKNMYKYLGANVTPGYQDAKTLKAEEKYLIQDCIKNHGLLTDKVWYESFEGVDTITENYIRNMRANGEKINKTPRILMSTIHAFKGGERDNICVLLDLMKASSQDLGDLASRELAAVTESASGKYRRAVEGLKADLAGIGEQFLKINTSLINFVDGIIEFVKRLPDPIKQALGFMGMLTAAAGPLIMLTGVLGNFFGYIIKGAYHFKALFKGGEGWKLLTPEILAAQKAGTLVEQTFYSDAKAAAILKQSINELALSYDNLAQKASMASMTTNPTVSTVGGSTIIAGRVVNPNSPYVGKEGTRAAGHHIHSILIRH